MFIWIKKVRFITLYQMHQLLTISTVSLHRWNFVHGYNVGITRFILAETSGGITAKTVQSYRESSDYSSYFRKSLSQGPGRLKGLLSLLSLCFCFRSHSLVLLARNCNDTATTTSSQFHSLFPLEAAELGTFVSHL